MCMLVWHLRCSSILYSRLLYCSINVFALYKILLTLNLSLQYWYWVLATLLQLWSYLCDSGPLHTRDWVPVTITLQALSLVEKAEPVQVHFTLRLRDQRSMWMQGEVYMHSYMASNGSCFMVTWAYFKNHLLEVGLTQNRETMPLRTLITVALFVFYHVWRLAWI